MLAILVSSLPMIVCGVLSVLIVLSLYDCRNMAKTRLLFFMATATLLYLAHFIYFNRLMAVIPLTDAIYCFCNLAVFPLYYLYIEELTDYRPNRWRQALCLLPSLLGGVAVGLLYILMDRQEMTLFIEHYLYGNEFASLSGLTFWQAMIHVAVRIVFALQVPLVLYFGFRRITAYNAVVETNYSDIEGKRIVWVKTLLVLFAVTSLVSFVFNLIGRQRFIDEAVPLAIPAVLFSMLLLLIGHVGLNQRFSVQDIEAEVFLESEPIPEDCAYSELLEKIRKLMSEEKLYLYPNLKVSDLARLLNSNRNYIYNAINVEMGISFSDYINSQRVDYASQLLKAHPELSINDVMFKSGFTSTSAFYRNFKKFKGITPTARRTR
ncbi:Helix-turn-helix domain-containing protein [Prevotella sp. ne3005]|nr:Helix-turn-helix domain-containing protein [Prevotella sp. ne3005]